MADGSRSPWGGEGGGWEGEVRVLSTYSTTRGIENPAEGRNGEGGGRSKSRGSRTIRSKQECKLPCAKGDTPPVCHEADPGAARRLHWQLSCILFIYSIQYGVPTVGSLPSYLH